MTAPTSVPLMLDTDVLIEIVKGRAAALSWLESLPVAPVVSDFVAMELLAGARNKDEMRRLQKALRAFPIVWPAATDMQRAMIDYLPLRLATGIGLTDCLIAATATGASHQLATFNMKHFRAVPDLVSVRPY